METQIIYFLLALALYPWVLHLMGVLCLLFVVAIRSLFYFTQAVIPLIKLFALVTYVCLFRSINSKSVWFEKENGEKYHSLAWAFLKVVNENLLVTKIKTEWPNIKEEKK